MRITLGEVADVTKGSLKGDAAKAITSLFFDSRKSREGGLFAALVGERTDAHAFVGDMLAKGCACLVSNENYFTENTVLVPDVKKALYDIAAYYRESRVQGVKAVAITGSVGKTTVKDMTGLVFSSAYKTFVTPGNSNSLLGVPVSLTSVPEDSEYAVLELGMSERGEISRLSNLVKPSVSIVTMIGSSHMESLGSVENIRLEKMDILAGAVDGGAVILDGDAEYEYSLKGKLAYNTYYCGIENPNCDFRALNIEQLRGRIAYDAVWDNGTRKTHIAVPAEGIHNVKNSLYAFAAGIICGIDPETAADALAGFSPEGNRLRVYETNGVTVIADCYNAAPESMKAAFAVLSSYGGHKLAVLGDMLELGENSPRMHRENAIKAAAVSDVLIFVGKYAEISAEAAKNASPETEIHVFAADEDSKHGAAKLILSMLKSGDTVLFKGSRAINLDDIIKEAKL